MITLVLRACSCWMTSKELLLSCFLMLHFHDTWYISCSCALFLCTLSCFHCIFVDLAMFVYTFFTPLCSCAKNSDDPGGRTHLPSFLLPSFLSLFPNWQTYDIKSCLRRACPLAGSLRIATTQSRARVPRLGKAIMFYDAWYFVYILTKLSDIQSNLCMLTKPSYQLSNSGPDPYLYPSPFVALQPDPVGPFS